MIDILALRRAGAVVDGGPAGAGQGGDGFIDVQKVIFRRAVHKDRAFRAEFLTICSLPLTP